MGCIEVYTGGLNWDIRGVYIGDLYWKVLGVILELQGFILAGIGIYAGTYWGLYWGLLLK